MSINLNQGIFQNYLYAESCMVNRKHVHLFYHTHAMNPYQLVFWYGRYVFVVDWTDVILTGVTFSNTLSYVEDSYICLEDDLCYFFPQCNWTVKKISCHCDNNTRCTGSRMRMRNNTKKINRWTDKFFLVCYRTQCSKHWAPMHSLLRHSWGVVDLNSSRSPDPLPLTGEGHYGNRCVVSAAGTGIFGRQLLGFLRMIWATMTRIVVNLMEVINTIFILCRWPISWLFDGGLK